MFESDQSEKSLDSSTSQSSRMSQNPMFSHFKLVKVKFGGVEGDSQDSSNYPESMYSDTTVSRSVPLPLLRSKIMTSKMKTAMSPF